MNKSEFRGEIYGIDFISYSNDVIFFIGYEYEERIPYLELLVYMKRAMRVFLLLNGGLKSNLDVYFMIKKYIQSPNSTSSKFSGRTTGCFGTSKD
ncbi:hypothetical protein [Bibersteinia trehalosi]|uniref:hypothetical protein n=1 Tax=Bibersteinia trehalosi TaxID=47735 RepID=UPI00104FC438|nr:hypothetical protein [Bibersteinia trehalosi]